ncbi:hypothetical protein [Mucilaginibacter hurinus]|uniref:hypothetical protein n=1 Tax=Mucilaginibacter hurinus TaxID=2201324 RepID=UPI001313EF56|nr:hypothetical protein [Mucilaginibacter hurinus]
MEEQKDPSPEYKNRAIALLANPLFQRYCSTQYLSCSLAHLNLHDKDINLIEKVVQLINL